MPRRRRYFEAGGLYEITIRTRTGLPFPIKESIILLIKSSLARTQRDFKVSLAHFIWMGNHAHILAVCRDALKLTKFYGELQKRLTDYIKRLHGLSHLDLWEGSPSIIRIADLEAAIERVAYFYANPALSNLVDSIEEYPGYSSYKAYAQTTHTLLNRHTERVPWIRCPAVPKVQSQNLSSFQDRQIKGNLTKVSKTNHRITIFPNLWMACFGVKSKNEIRAVNKRISEQLNALQSKARTDRETKGAKIMGPVKLLNQPLMLSHTPKKYSRRIFVIARNKQIRIRYIAFVKRICEQCKVYLEKWKKFDFSFQWPPGIFPPPLPMVANALA